MAKYNKRIVDAICSHIRADSYTIAEICRMVGISEDTYYTWKKTKPEFSESIKKAEESFKKDILVECKRSLRKLITGYTVQEKKTITVDSGRKDEKGKPIPKIKEQAIVEKHIQPSLGAIIHYQTNQDPDNWKNKHSTEVTGRDGRDLFANMTDDELDARILELERKLGK